VLTASPMVAVSLAFAPRRGLVWNWIRPRRHAEQLITAARGVSE